ncbi:YbhB/YbcL family Raf kinase inhibitor-like protein [Sphingomonas oleivorans]|uniref:YbhB/YbcL family Raf kinase inhibitor-like protein n=1 Tax=Sphingomonas oleivorans TaxID=1735121 RepID=A0A2T5G371_9SPHN|nr:YbhB/YbcL family Raf kinase inhibitor-like protein [Sphingomonas oleivorans]PTQ13595.1 YbhB/YbcL family Raf kinase inhibitor-like protein [Sphingomonas oleivorans]
MTLTISSPAFADGERIPDQYVRDSDNRSPPLEWQGEPEGTMSYALIVEDPDAPRGTFRHWAICDIPANRHELGEGEGQRGRGLHQLANDFGNAGYDGPQPPRGDGPHHYRFRLAALDTDHLDIPASARADAVWNAARPHILAEAELTGIYER